MTEHEKIADYWADWLIDAVGMATQNRALLRGDPAEDGLLTQAIVLNGKKAILNAMKALSDTSTDRTWHEAMADRVLQLKIGGAKNLSCDAVLGLIAFVRDGEGSVAVTYPDREGK